MRTGGSIHTETNSISNSHSEIRVKHKVSKDTVQSYFCSELAFAFQQKFELANLQQKIRDEMEGGYIY